MNGALEVSGQVDKGQQWVDLATKRLTEGIIRHPLSGKDMTHAEFSEWAGTLPEHGIYTRADAHADLARNVEARDHALRTSHEDLVRSALIRHRGATGSGDGILNNNYYDLAAGRALQNEVRQGARPNPVTLHTGAPYHPSQTRQGYHSFSENWDTAYKFQGLRGGDIYTAKPGSVRGIKLEDYGVRSYGDEQEWLVLPSSTRGLRPNGNNNPVSESGIGNEWA